MRVAPPPSGRRSSDGVPPFRSETVLEDPPRSPALDFAISFCGLWLAAGFLWDSWAHLHVGVETFFTPYHAIFYAAMLVAACTFAIFANANRRRGYRYPRLLPVAYRRALIGVPVFFLGGVGDLIWHTFFGVENRIEAVTSPTHLIIGYGVVLVLSGPIRSAFAARSSVLSLRAQLPFIFCLASILEFAHLGMSYAFDPSAARMDAPPDQVASSPYYLLQVALVLYKTGTGVMIVILTSLVEMAFALWIASRFVLAPGAMTLFFVLGDGMIAAALTNDRPILIIRLCMDIVAGLVADSVLSRNRRKLPALPSLSCMRTFAIAVPIAYYGTFFALTIVLEGTWWNWSLIGGVIVWSVLVGFGLTFLMNEPAPLESALPAIPLPRDGDVLDPQPAPANALLGARVRVLAALKPRVPAGLLFTVECAMYLAAFAVLYGAYRFICTL